MLGGRQAPALAGSPFADLLTQQHIEFDDRQAVERAIQYHAAGLDFADVLHHARYAACGSMATFDDRGLVRRAQNLSLIPTVSLPR